MRLLPTLQLQHNDQPYLPIHSPEEERLRRFELLNQAFHEYQAGSDQAGAARAGLNVAIAALKKRHLADVFLWTQQAQGLLRGEQDPAGLALAHMLLASASQTAGQVQEVAAHQEAAAALIQQHNLPDLPLLDF